MHLSLGCRQTRFLSTQGIARSCTTLSTRATLPLKPVGWVRKEAVKEEIQILAYCVDFTTNGTEYADAYVEKSETASAASNNMQWHYSPMAASFDGYFA